MGLLLTLLNQSQSANQQACYWSPLCMRVQTDWWLEAGQGKTGQLILAEREQPSLQVGPERWTSLSLGEGSNRLYFSLSLAQTGPHPVQIFLGGIQSQSLKSVSLQNQGNFYSQGGKNKVEETFRTERKGRNSISLLIWLEMNGERDARYF